MNDENELGFQSVRPFNTTISRPSVQQVHFQGGPSVVLCGHRVVACVRTSSRAGSDTTSKQAANLAVEGAEESLSILPDYTPTVRPRPSAVDHLGATC